MTERPNDPDTTPADDDVDPHARIVRGYDENDAARSNADNEENEDR